MNDKVRLPAKLTIPAVAAAVPRPRLFQALDKARKRPIIWVTSPAGAGKTVLVASYLQQREVPALWYQIDETDTDAASMFYYLRIAVDYISPAMSPPLPLLTGEYRGGLAAFAMNFFRVLFERLMRPTTIVFDNFHELGVDTPMQSALLAALDQTPDDVNIVVISREEPLGIWSRLLASKRISVIDWKALSLTLGECRDIVAIQSRRSQSQSLSIEAVHSYTQGWAAGVILLTEQIDGDFVRQPQLELMSRQSIFDYFATEILRRGNPDVQSFLLKTAYLTSISLAAARELTSNENASVILNGLVSRNFFTTRRGDGTYEYHPLFRAFLQSQVDQQYGAEERSAQLRASGMLLVSNDDFESGIALLLEAGAWATTVEWLRKHGQSLLGQGRSATVQKWLSCLPPPMVETDPGLLYLRGMCQVDANPALARADFCVAFAMFEKQDDASPVYLCWSRIIESYIAEMNDFSPIIPWLERYDSLLRAFRIPVKTSIENTSLFVYIAGLTNACCTHPGLPACVERAERLIEAETRVERRAAYIALLIPYFLWQGVDSRATALIERLDTGGTTANTRVQLDWLIWKTLYAAMAGRANDSLQAAQKGLELAESTGMHRGDSQLTGYAIIGQVTVGNIVVAESLLARLAQLPPSGRVGEAIYNHYASTIAAHQGHLQRAATYAERAVSLADEASLAIGSVSYRIGLAYIYTTCGKSDAAVALLKQARPKAIAMGSRRFVSICDFCMAAICVSRGEMEDALVPLRDALTNAQAGNFSTASYCPRNMAAQLYDLALRHDICSNYAKSTIVATGLDPPTESVSEKWPWPVRIYTLGRFIVKKNDAPLVFSGKAQKKPLELLKLLVAYGGRDVAVHKVIQELWPKSEPESAKATFRSTLLRLRRLIGDDVILFNESYLTINSRYGWLDTWALKRMSSDLAVEKVVQRDIDSLFELYAGPFLPDDDDAWVYVQRERARSQFLRLITQISRRMERDEQQATLITLYRKAIEIEPLAEEFYQRLMRLLAAADRTAEALGVYRSCRQMLLAVLKIEPGSETKAILADIQSRSGH